MRRHMVIKHIDRDADIILFSRLNPGITVDELKNRYKITRHAAARIKRDKRYQSSRLIRYIIFKIEEREDEPRKITGTAKTDKMCRTQG